jgi:hypothetical protein
MGILQEKRGSDSVPRKRGESPQRRVEPPNHRTCHICHHYKKKGPESPVTMLAISATRVERTDTPL